MQYRKTFKVKCSAKTALAYIADFRSLIDWEPSVLSVVQTHGQAPGVGAEYRIVMRFMGRESSMQYRCTDYAGDHAILIGQGDGFSAYDRIDVRVLPHGCEVTYFTDITLTTVLGRVLHPLIAVVFGFNVRKAVGHLKQRLDALA